MIKTWTVYMHLNKFNLKAYIGITSQELNKRWKSGWGYQKNIHFWNAIQKYGWDNFDHIILADGLTEEDAKNKEQYFIAKYKSNNREFGYNMTEGGEGTIGYKHTEETKELNRIAHLGKTVSIETRQKMSKSHKGKMTGVEHPFYGRKLPEETKRKISESLMGRTSQQSGKDHHLSKAVVQLSLDGQKINEFDSMGEARRKTGADPSAIAKCCKGKLRTTSGFIWMYAEDYYNSSERGAA